MNHQPHFRLLFLSHEAAEQGLLMQTVYTQASGFFVFAQYLSIGLQTIAFLLVIQLYIIFIYIYKSNQSFLMHSFSICSRPLLESTMETLFEIDTA